jgi:hypothetical protein
MINFLSFSLNSFDCLHPGGFLNTIITIDEVPKDDSMKLSSNIVLAPPEAYYTHYPSDNETDQNKSCASLGLGDFFIFNLMLLTIQPCSSSIITKICITIVHIIAVQLGQEGTNWLGRLYGVSSKPAVSLSFIMVSIYAIVLNSFIDY